MDDLKPCVHCGASAVIKRNKTTMVSCTHCSVSSFQILGDTNSAITAWNQRPATPSLTDAEIGKIHFSCGPNAIEFARAIEKKVRGEG